MIVEFVRKIVNSDVLMSILDLPEELKSRRVEIIVLPFDENSTQKQSDKSKSLMGALKEYANPDLLETEKNAWAKAAGDKHVNP